MKSGHSESVNTDRSVEAIGDDSNTFFDNPSCKSDSPVVKTPANARPESPDRPLVVPVPRLTLRLDEAASALGLSRRSVERLRSAGRFPNPDVQVNKMPLWRPSSLERWLDQQADGREGLSS